MIKKIIAYSESQNNFLSRTMDIMLRKQRGGKYRCQDHVILTFIFVICSNCENCVLDVFILVNLSLVKVLVKVGGVVVLVRDSNPDEL